MTKTKIALAAALFAATSSAAFAQGYSTRTWRIAIRATRSRILTAMSVGKLQRFELSASGTRTLQSAPVRLQKHGNVRLQSAPVLQQRDVALPSAGGGAYYEGDREFNVDRFDRASSPLCRRRA